MKYASGLKICPQTVATIDVFDVSIIDYVYTLIVHL